MTLLECCTQYASKFGKLSNGVSQDWKRSGCFHFIPKDGQFQESLKFHTTALISYASKVILKILQARLQLYTNWELPDVHAGFRKGRGNRDQLVDIHWITAKAREFQKHMHFCFIDYVKAFDCGSQKNSWKSLKRWKYQTILPVTWEIHV